MSKTNVEMEPIELVEEPEKGCPEEQPTMPPEESTDTTVSEGMEMRYGLLKKKRRP